VLLFLLVFLYRGLVRGELPNAISGRGAEWQEIVETTASNADRVQAQLDALRDEVDALKQQTEAPKP